MGSLDSRRLVEYVKENSRTKPYPSKNDVAEEFGVSKDTVDNHGEEPRRNGKIVKIEDEGVTRYCFSQYHNTDIREKIEDAFEESYSLLAETRYPTIGEIANLSGNDTQDEFFRENYHKLKKDLDFSEPTEQVREEKNSEALNIIIQAVLRDRGIGDREKLPEHLVNKEVDDYIQDNRNILERIQVHRSSLSPNGKADSVTIEFPEELQILLDRSQKRVNLEPVENFEEERTESLLSRLLGKLG